MKERPILFSGAMVRAILDGKKTQTRRILSSVTGRGKLAEVQTSETPGYDIIARDSRMLWNDFRIDNLKSRCPYGMYGDRLWVRETWNYAEREGYDAAPRDGRPGFDEADPDAYNFGPCWYRATDNVVVDGSPWKPSIFMPRAASRLTLEITGVRVERVQDISEADAIAEGCAGYRQDTGLPSGDWERFVDPEEEYAMLWDSINGKKPGSSWAENPFVWVVEFKKVDQ